MFKTEEGKLTIRDSMENGAGGQEPSEDWFTTLLARVEEYYNAAQSLEEAADRVEEVFKAAEDAASSANEASEKCNTATVNANEATKNANAAAEKAESASESAQNAATRANSAAQIAEQYGVVVTNVESSEDGITVTWSDSSSQVIPVSGQGGLAFDGGYQDEEGKLHLTLNGEDIEGFDPIQLSVGGGGGGTGSKLTFAMYTASSISISDTAEECKINFKIASVDIESGEATGNINVSITVNGTMRENRSLAQGENAVDVLKYLVTGSNTVQLTATDSYGATATRKIAITMDSFTIECSLASVAKITDGSLTFTITPTGSGTKTIYTYVDDVLLSTDSVSTSGRKLTKNITGLTHGAHRIEVYGEMTVNGATLESNHITSAVANILSGNTEPVIAVNWPSGELAQYTNLSIEHIVVDPSNNPTNVSYLINSVVYSTDEIDQSAHTWSYRPVTSGSMTFGIMCGTKLESKTLVIGSIGSDVQEVTDGLAIKVDPSIMTSLSDWTYGNYSIELSEGFDEVNGGLQVDENGVHCIRITAGDRMKLNYPLFSGDARKTGKEIKIVYKLKDSSNREAEAISCMSGKIGLKVMANNVFVSGDQTTVKLPVCEDEKTELDINIQQDSEDRLLYMWERCSTFAYTQYASNESFTHQSETGITFGSDDVDVILYMFRAYNRDLTETEIKANYIFDGADGNEILDRQDRNDIYDSSGKVDVQAAAQKNPYAHIMVINAERMTLGKKDTVAGTLQHINISGGPQHNWTAAMTMVVQGTSSVEHAPTAGPNVNFTFTNGITLEDGTVIPEGYAMYGAENSIPTNLLTYKKNIASQDHIVNACVSEWYNRYQPYIRTERENDPRVRDCMESVMCVVFFHNTGSSAVQVGPDIVQPDETIFFGLGNLCSNKDSYETFQYDDIVIEVLNNTEPQIRFKSDDLSGDNFSNNYDFRYLNAEKYTEAQAIAEWQKVQSFVFQTDWTAATNTALAQAVVINGQAFSVDSAEYRKARWKAEAPNYFEMETLYNHKNMVLLFLLRDNCGKNMFWSIGENGKWRLIFAWDHDTGLRRNNEGYVDIDRPYMDYDTIGTADVYNAADNAIWTNIRECNADDMKENYLALESAGGTDLNAFYEMCDMRQSYICESLWIEDAEHNAIRTMQNLGTTAYLGRATGKLRLHIKHALIEQKTLIDSFYCSTASTSESASFRGYTPTTWTGVEPNGLVGITPYADMFINMLAGSNKYQQRAYAGEEVMIDISAYLNDTEIYLRDAPWIMKIGDLSALYLGQFEASKLKRVKSLPIGSDIEGYQNTNFTTASFENCKKLEEVNLGGLVNATKAFDFSQNIYLKKIYSKGSGATGFTFAKNGRLKEAHLNAVSSLIMKGLRMLETFEMESYENLSSVIIEESPTVDSYSLAKAASNLARVRLLGINWSVPVTAYDVLMRLHGIHGIDDEGYDVSNGVLSGSVYFNSISETKYNTIVDAIPEITFTYGEKLEECTVTFKNDDGEVLYVGKTEKGGSIQDPIAAGLIDTPTKSSTVETGYKFYKWDTALDYIVGDTVITATYSEYDMVYNVQYVDKGGTVLETYDVKAHGSCTYQGEDLQLAGYVWMGWDKTTTDVVENMIVNAVYIYPTLPPAVLDMTNYDYAYSEDANDNSAYSYSELYELLIPDKPKNTFQRNQRLNLLWRHLLLMMLALCLKYILMAIMNLQMEQEI